MLLMVLQNGRKGFGSQTLKDWASKSVRMSYSVSSSEYITAGHIQAVRPVNGTSKTFKSEELRHRGAPPAATQSDRLINSTTTSSLDHLPITLPHMRQFPPVKDIFYIMILVLVYTAMVDNIPSSVSPEQDIEATSQVVTSPP